MPLISNGVELRRRRELKGMTQEQFADQAGYTSTHVSQVERGVHNAGPKYLLAAARIFECEIRDITSGTRPRQTRTSDRTNASAA